MRARSRFNCWLRASVSRSISVSVAILRRPRHWRLKIVGTDTVTGGLILVSFEELQDSSFDLDRAIRRRFGTRYARGLEKALTLGTALPDSATGGLPVQAAVGVGVNPIVKLAIAAS